MKIFFFLLINELLIFLWISRRGRPAKPGQFLGCNPKPL